MNPENLTISEILQKIDHLERSIHLSIMNFGTENFCKNRIQRVKTLRSYLV